VSWPIRGWAIPRMQGNRDSQTLQANVVYWGAERAGKTAVLRGLRRYLNADGGTCVYSVNADDERTLFFDLYQLPEFHVGSYRIRARLVAGPGAPSRHETRRTLLTDVDAIVFVADARRTRLEETRESLTELRQALLGAGLPVGSVPITYVFNRQDSGSALKSSELKSTLGLAENQPVFETIASAGTGVLDAFSATFRELVASLAGRLDVEDFENNTVIPHKLMLSLFQDGDRPLITPAPPESGSIVINVSERPPPAGAEPDLSVEPRECKLLGAESLDAQILIAERDLHTQSRILRFEQRNQELMAVNRVARSILGAMESENLLVVLLDSTADYLSASHAACVLFNGSEKKNLRTHVRGFGRDPVLDFPREHARKFLDLIRDSDGPIPLQEDRNGELLAALRGVDRRVVSAFFAPLKNVGQPAGWIGIYQVEDERPLNTRELLFLSSISRLAGLGVEKIDLVEALQRRTMSQETSVQDQTARLEMANAKVRALNRALESKVRERTKQIRLANKKLQTDTASALSAARLAGMTQVASTLSHRVHHPAASLASHLDTMRGSLDDLRATVAVAGPEASSGMESIDGFEEILSETLECVEQITNVVGSLRRFGGAAGDSSEFSLNSAVADAATVLGESIEAHGELQLRLGSVPKVRGNAGELRQAVLAILTNAAEAVARSGEKGKIEVITYTTNGEINLRVKDNGPGIPESLLPTVFEPFVTTKQGQPHAGLGLHSAFASVRNQGGKIRVRSKVGEGTVVTVVLPS
ncbi:MAG: ATP-binding protein, partial [Planctomycetota bacterium]